MGIPDKMYGAKAIVVIKATPTNSSPEIREEMKNSVPKFLGPDYMVGGVVFLSELGLSDWPTNSSHKVVKKDIVDAIEARRGQFGL